MNVKDVTPAINQIENLLTSKFSARGACLLDKAESVKAQLGAALTDIQAFDAFYQKCASIGGDLTDAQFRTLQADAAKINSTLNSIAVPKRSNAGTLLVIVAVVVLMMLIAYK